MARSARSNAPTRRPPRGGYGWFLLLLAIGGVLALVALAPDSLRQSLGIANDIGLSDGDLPLSSTDSDVDIEERSAALGHQDISVDVTVDRTDAAQTAVTEPTDPEPERETAARVDDRDREVIEAAIEQARTYLESYRWDEARERAGAILDRDMSPQLATMARRIVHNAGKLQELFQRLDLRGELRRNHNTHPLLVRFDIVGGDTMEAYPLLDMRGSEVPDTDNPVAWIESRLNTQGAVALQSVQGGSTEYQRDQIRNLRPADLDRIKDEARQALTDQIRRVREQPEMQRDPLTWYEIARFAYQNRIDNHVVRMLERAIDLDPLLVDTIKEDNANSLFLDMVRFREQGNNAGVNAAMVSLRNQYRETAVFAQAQAYYNQELEQLRTARAAQRQRQQEALAQRQQARIEVARQVRDDAAVARIERDEPVVEAAPEPPPASGGSGDAHELMNRAMEIYSRANHLPPSVERDQLYGQAIPLFTQARDLFLAAGDEENAVRANMLRFGSIKNRRAISR